MSDSPAIEKRRYKRLPASAWACARAEWETGETTLEGLAVKYGVSRRALQAHFRKASSAKGSKAKEIAKEVAAAVFAPLEFDKSERIRLGRETRNADYENALRVERAILAQLDEAEKDGPSAFRASAAIKTLSLAAQALERVQGLKWRALGLDRETETDELPRIEIVNLLEEDIAAIRDARESDGLECDSDDDDRDAAESDESVVVTEG